MQKLSLLFWLSLLITFCSVDLCAQQNATSDAEIIGPPAPLTINQITEDVIKAKRDDLATKIETAKKTLETATVAGATEIIQAKIQVLDRHNLLLSQQLSAVQQRNALQTAKQQLEEQKEKYKTEGPEGERPFSYLMLDNLRTELKAQKEKITTIDASIEAAQKVFEQAKTRLSDAESARRISSEQLAGNPTPLLQLRHDNVHLEVDAANDAVRLRQIEVNNLKSEKELQQAQIEYQEQKVKDIALDVRFREEDLNEQLSKIDGQVLDLERQRKEAETAKDNFAELNLEKARRTFQNDASLLANEKMKLAQYNLELYQTKENIYGIRRDRTEERKEFWNQRYQTVNGLADYSQLQNWKAEIAATLETYQNEENQTKTQISYLQSSFDTIEAKKETHQDDRALYDVYDEQTKIYADHIDTWQTNISSINASRDVIQKLTTEIDKELNIWTWEEVFAYSWQVAGDFLNQEIYTYKDENNEDASITYGEIAFAFSIFIFGWILAKLISKLLGYVLHRRFGVEEGIVLSIRSLFFYFVVALLIPLSLKTIAVDLTAFAFLGGALAIAVGFGSQNIFSNFISGIIMLVERPVRIGDIVDVEGITGKITQIGLRSTLLNTWDNQDIVIPNTYFLENRVTNFTLENWVIRAVVDVGVAYGTDTRLVQKLIRKAIDEHGLILKYPEPFIVFKNFGDSSLDFRAYFWVDMKSCNRLVVESDIRHRINKLFQENHVEIPFPQRDLHFRSGKPVDVRVLPPETAETSDNLNG